MSNSNESTFFSQVALIDQIFLKIFQVGPRNDDKVCNEQKIPTLRRLNSMKVFGTQNMEACLDPKLSYLRGKV
jgi:hypothetical protein